MDRISEDAADLLRRNLDLWFPRCRAERGFHQAFARDWSPLPEETRFLVFQARQLWVAATASEAFPDRSGFYLEFVAHGRKVLSKLLYDRLNGGHWWTVDRDGRPTGAHPQIKVAYGLAFALFGLSAAARVAGSQESRSEADDAFEFLERLHDAEHGGYFESSAPDGTPLAKLEPDAVGTEFGPSGGASLKSQNTHLHLLEALLEYRRIATEPVVGNRIEELVRLFSGPMLAEPGVNRAKFRADWTPIGERWDIGHDLEAAYLLLLAPEMEASWSAARSLIAFNLEHGFDPVHGGCYAGGPRPGELSDKTKVWWAQAEAINGLVYGLAKLPDLAFPIAGVLDRLWNWTRDRQWDAKYGGFYARLNEQGGILGDGAKAEPWKACYHDTRALLNLTWPTLVPRPQVQSNLP